ncbi:MAG: hypothetical protein GX605_06355 [Chloroflexi bacterium]|nr:hypothetical protein [Chloroflexota bacterium]
MTERLRQVDRWLLALLLGAAFALRLWGLGADSLWYDETVTLFIAQESLPRLLAHTAGDIHPPLYYLLQHLWLAAAGNGEFAAAFFSLFWGVLLVALGARLALAVAGQREVAGLTALLLAFSPYGLWYSQEVRMYTLGASLGLLAALALWRWLGALAARPGLGGRWMAVYALCGALGLYTLYYFAFLLAFLGLWGLAALARLPRSGRAQRMAAWVGAQGAILALFGPWLPIAWRQAANPPVPPWRSFTPLGQVLAESWQALALGQSAPAGVGWLFVALAALLWLGGAMALARRGRRQAVWFLAGYTWVPLAAIFLASYATPLYHPRYLFTYSPPFYALAAAGLAAARRWGRRLPLALLLTVLVGFGWSAGRLWAVPDYRADAHGEAVQTLESLWRPGDAVLIHAGYVYTALEHYYNGQVGWRGRLVDYPTAPTPAGPVWVQAGSVDGEASLGWGDRRSDFYAMPAAEAHQALEDLFRRHPRVWVYRCYDTVTDPQGLVRGWLGELGTPFHDQVFSGPSSLRLQGYVSRLAAAPTAAGDGPTFGGALRVVGVQAQEGQEGTVWADLAWQRVGPMAADWVVSLRLYDEAGQRVAQVDETPLGPLYGPREWPAGQTVTQPLRLALPLGTPPGAYSVRLTVYDRQTRQPMPDEAGQAEVQVGALRLTQPDHRAVAMGMGIPYGARFAGGARLLDARPATYEPQPGEPFTLELLWQREGAGATETPTLFLQAADDGGALLWAEERPLGGPSYPYTAWAEGEVVRTRHTLRLPADTPSGGYALWVGLLGPYTGGRLPASQRPGLSADRLRLGTLTVRARQPLPAAATAFAQPSGAEFGQGIVLLDYDVEPAAAAAGEEMTVHLRWQARRAQGGDYHLFLHLTAVDSPLPLAQADAPPLGGALPTGRWLPGETLADRLTLTLPAGTPPGGYRLRLGFYEPSTGARLPVRAADGAPLGDSLDLGLLQVR